MALQLFLLRHAEAESQKSGVVDFDRVLTQKGIEQCLNWGKQLKKINLNPDYIISSPSARTKMTAKFTFEAWGLSTDAVEYDDSIYHGDETLLLEIIHNIKPEHQSVLFIGHNPTITGVASRLIKNLKSGLDTCDLLWIEFNTFAWKTVDNKNSLMKDLISPNLPMTHD
jgi:phosphohistidine phosphatase